ncbi:MAG: ABC transporter permease subunit [Cyanobacteria bacterium P01_A01_bin.84]
MNWKLTWKSLSIIAIIWSLQIAGIFQQELINFGGINLFLNFWIAALSPELSLDFLLITLDATFKTLAFAVSSTFFCIIIGIFGGILSSQIWWNSFQKHTKQGNNKNNKINTPWLIVRGTLAIPRAIHEIIWGLFFINIFGIDSLVALLAIAIPFGAITAKVFSEILDETSPQALQALLNAGVSPLNAFIYSLIPQALPNLVSYAFYRFECSIRSAAVLGYIGAGGLGYQIRLSLQSLRYEQVWTLIFALLLLNGTTDLLSGIIRKHWGLPHRMNLKKNHLNNNQDTYQQKKDVPQYVLKEDRKKEKFGSGDDSRVIPTGVRSQNILLILTVVIGLLIFSFKYLNVTWTKLYSYTTWERLVNITQEAFPPQQIDINQLLLFSTRTLAMSILAIAFAGIFGIILAFPAARNWEGKPKKTQLFLFSLTRFILLFSRALPEQIWALVLLLIMFPGILPGAIALGLHNGGILGRLMAEVIENLDQKPLKALKALGATNPQIFFYGILPPTLPRFLSYTLYRWEVCIRSTVIVGLVGAGGLGRLLVEQLSSFDYQSILTTLIIFIILTWIVDIISTSARRSLK